MDANDTSVRPFTNLLSNEGALCPMDTVDDDQDLPPTLIEDESSDDEGCSWNPRVDSSDEELDAEV